MTEQKTNVNAASARELALLPGIGRTLAERMVEYRTAVGPFEEAGQITAVPGIGEATYRSVADRLLVTAREEGSEPADEGSGEGGGEDEGPPEDAAVGAEAEPAAESGPEGEPDLPEPGPEEPGLERPGGESGATMPGAGPEHAAEGEGPPGEAAVGTEGPEGVSREGWAEESPREPAESRRPWEKDAPPPSVWSQLSWLWTAILGGVLGMVFALVVFAGINGSLDIASSRAFLNVESRVDGLAADVDALQGEVSGLQARVDLLEGLAERMDAMESDVGDLRQETAALTERTDGLERDVVAVSEELQVVADHVDTLQEQAERTESFFHRLQALLNELFGEAGGEPTAAPDNKGGV